MPFAAPRPCSHPGCRSLAVKDGRCAEHQKPTWAKKPGATKRITGRRLQAMRAALFERDPLCVKCRERGLVELATQRDHIVPLEEGGADDAGNEQGLCEPCHLEKSLGEALRARRGASSRDFASPGVGRKSGPAGRKPSGSPRNHGEG